MKQNKISTQSDAAGRAAYEAPAIEVSASFERLALACAHTEADVLIGLCRVGMPPDDSPAPNS
jgi:hypothetical protein